MSDYCMHTRTIEGLEVWEGDVRTVHVEKAHRSCILREEHDGPHHYGQWIDDTTGDLVDPFVQPRSTP